MKSLVCSFGLGATAIAAILAFGTIGAQALSLGLGTDAIYSDGAGGGSSDPDGLFLPVPAPGSVSSSTAGGFGDFSTGPGIAPGATADLNALGFTHTRVNNIFASPPQSGSFPYPAHTMIAESVFSQTETNNSGSAQDYSLAILLKNMSLGLVNFCGNCFSTPGGNPFDTPGSDALGASIEYSVTVDGVLLFMARADLFGTALGGAHMITQTHMQDGTDPNGAAISGTLNVASIGAGSFTPNSVGITFDDLFGTLDVGTFADGQSFTVVSTMRATVTGGPFEMGGFAYIGDPNALNGDSQTAVLTSTAANPISEAATLALFGLGIAGLGIAARRRQR